MLITLISAKGAPGVTTTTLALAAEWPRTAVAIDADPAGGDIAAGLGRGSWPQESTLVGLAVEARQTSVEMALRKLVVRPGVHTPLVLAGVTMLGQAAALPWHELAAGFRGIDDADLVCDGGRYIPADGITLLLQASHHVVLVTRSSLPAVRASARLMPIVREALPPHTSLSMLVVDSGQPYAAMEIAANCGAVLLGELPHDPRAAEVWSEGRRPRRGFRRSHLQRAARELADRLAEARLAMTGGGGL